MTGSFKWLVLHAKSTENDLFFFVPKNAFWAKYKRSLLAWAIILAQTGRNDRKSLNYNSAWSLEIEIMDIHNGHHSWHIQLLWPFLCSCCCGRVEKRESSCVSAFDRKKLFTVAVLSIKWKSFALGANLDGLRLRRVKHRLNPVSRDGVIAGALLRSQV